MQIIKRFENTVGKIIVSVDEGIYTVEYCNHFSKESKMKVFNPFDGSLDGFAEVNNCTTQEMAEFEACEDWFEAFKLSLEEDEEEAQNEELPYSEEVKACHTMNKDMDVTIVQMTLGGILNLGYSVRTKINGKVKTKDFGEWSMAWDYYLTQIDKVIDIVQDARNEKFMSRHNNELMRGIEYDLKRHYESKYPKCDVYICDDCEDESWSLFVTNKKNKRFGTVVISGFLGDDNFYLELIKRDDEEENLERVTTSKSAVSRFLSYQLVL